VWLILAVLGAHVSLKGALGVEALTKVINTVGALNPGNIGAYEGGNMLIGKLFAFGGSTGLALAFARRARGIFRAIAGALCLVFLSKRPKPDASGNTEPDQSSVAVILTDGLPESSMPLRKVGGVPVLLRAILGLRKGGFRTIVIVAGPLTRPFAQGQLQRSGRLPDLVEWFDRGADGQTLAGLILNLGARGAQRVAFVAADTTYHSSVLQRLWTWDGEGAGVAPEKWTKFRPRMHTLHRLRANLRHITEAGRQFDRTARFVACRIQRIGLY
jgi:hypothetical protein